MHSRQWVILIAVAFFLAAAFGESPERYPRETLAQQCIRIYADDLPDDARIRHVNKDEGNLVVYIHHLDWTGEIRCVLYRNGSLDDVGTLNRKIDVLWSEPPMPPNP